ncbi:MAG: hypothetical protein KF803_03025 [Cyclobacteriaceae bacterium]|nr:hypothetical protein [Cyclobacteriaceae bacterium]
MLDYIYLSQTTPHDESCAQVGSEDYMQRSRIEARVYMDQLKRTFGMNPHGSFFKIVRCPHDFGTYLDIRFYYDDEDQTHVTYMMNIETGCDKWDDQARDELKSQGYDMFNTLQTESVKKGC